ncbi:MAG: hypothetical protein LBT51_09235, partial [Fusobacteriaceae bacterium]|nr:hypothetical protein [Fusobacteriaceae bacterium]
MKKKHSKNWRLLFATLTLLVGSSLYATEHSATTTNLSTLLTTGTAAGDTVKLANDIPIGAKITVGASGIILDGDGHTISGDNMFLLFELDPSDISSINNITFEKGNNLSTTLTGLAVYTSKKRGGAIYINENSDIKINNAKFLNNEANYGGAIGIFGEFSGEIINSTFYRNVTSGANPIDNGGAIHASGKFLGNIINSEFKENSADSGGAIYVANPFSGNIENTKFLNNKAINNTAATGGAISAEYFTGIIKNSEFFENEADMGGAISLSYDFTNSSSIINSIFEKNSALGIGSLSTGNGGAINVGGFSPEDLSGTKFIENHASGDGGAIHASKNIAIHAKTGNVTFSGNTAGSTRNAIYAQNAGSYSLQL